MQEFCIKKYEHVWTCVYMLSSSSCIIPNVSDNVQAQRNPRLFKEMMCFIWLQIVTSGIENLENETKLYVNKMFFCEHLYLSHIR